MIERPRDASSLSAPARAVTADGESTELLDEVRVFFGVTTQAPRPRASSTRAERPKAERGASVTAVEPPQETQAIPAPELRPIEPQIEPTTRSAPRGGSTTQPSGPPAVVHLSGGASKRGELVVFEPDRSTIVLRQGGHEESLPFDEVFAVFVGVMRGSEPTTPSGTRIGVKLSNGKELVGASPDYAPGAAAMTLVPDDRRNVDRVWIPAWSVTEIRLA
jgi:hypothetical protein